MNLKQLEKELSKDPEFNKFYPGIWLSGFWTELKIIVLNLFNKSNKGDE